MTEILARFVANPAVSGVLFAAGLAVVGLWLAAAWWTFQDISRRTESELARLLAPAWVVVSSPLMLPLSLGVYTLVRPQMTVGDQRTRGLFSALAPVFEQAVLCPGCGTRADEAWRRCPTCTTWLQAPCAHCGGWSNVELELCPWCGSDVLGLPRVASPHELAALAEGNGFAPAPGPVVAVTAVTAVSVGKDAAGARDASMRGAAAALVEHAAAADRIDDAEEADVGPDIVPVAIVEQSSGEDAEVVEAMPEDDLVEPAGGYRGRGSDTPVRRLPRPIRARAVPPSRRMREAPGSSRVRKTGSGDGSGDRPATRTRS